MDIERLTKSQIVLLTLLVSFVTSIATGIVTVSLMDQAPPAIAQTVNRVVERTVERVVPTETQTATVITQEKTVIVKETELIAQAVARIEPSIVRVYKKGTEADTLAGLGVALSPEAIAVDAASITAEGTYEVELPDKKRVLVTAKGKAVDGVLLLSAQTSEGAPKFKAAAFNSDALQLGQTVVAFSHSGSLRVASGIVTGLGSGTDTGQAATTFETNIPAERLLPGSPIVNTDGAVVGMYVSGQKTFAPTARLLQLVKPKEETAENGTASQG